MDYDRDRLLYRRQFLLSEQEQMLLPTWQGGLVAGKYHLYAHPDLGMEQARLGDIELTLLGYIIDPHHPEWHDGDILNHLLSKADNREALFRATNSFGGRWILFYADGNLVIAFTDPCGLRSLYFTRTGDGPLCCASQPGLMVKIQGWEPSDEAKTGFLDTAAYQNQIEYWLPSGTSQYDGIAHLVPNHYLDLGARVQHRFWPWSRKASTGFDEGITRTSGMLKKLMHAAEHRFPLAVSITAGYDTRSILAATREISERIYYYSMMYYKLTPQSSDVEIPNKLLTSMGLVHHTLDCSGEMDEGFREIYMQNVDLAHEAWGHIARGLYRKYPREMISVKGVCSEIGRMTSSRFGYLEKLDGETLAEIFFMGASPFAVQAFDKWSRESVEAIRANNYRALDIFYWEQKMGSWQAVSQLEWDIVQETFSPFNCRELLEIILSVDSKYRKKPKERLMRAMMADLWPVVLTQPLNPRPLKIKLRKRFRLVWRSKMFKRLRETLRRVRHGGYYGQ